MSPTRLTDEEIQKSLKTLNGWTRDGDAIERKLVFDSFLDAIAFINRIATHAENADHHPEIFNVYNKVDLRLTTHDAGGLTAKDFALAAEIDGAVG